MSHLTSHIYHPLYFMPPFQPSKKATRREVYNFTSSVQGVMRRLESGLIPGIFSGAIFHQKEGVQYRSRYYSAYITYLEDPYVKKKCLLGTKSPFGVPCWFFSNYGVLEFQRHFCIGLITYLLNPLNLLFERIWGDKTVTKPTSHQFATCCYHSAASWLPRCVVDPFPLCGAFIWRRCAHPLCNALHCNHSGKQAVADLKTQGGCWLNFFSRHVSGAMSGALANDKVFAILKDAGLILKITMARLGVYKLRVQALSYPQILEVSMTCRSSFGRRLNWWYGHMIHHQSLE